MPGAAGTGTPRLEMQPQISNTTSPMPAAPSVASTDAIRCRGHADLTEGLTSARLEPQEFIEAGEHVVVPCTFHATGRDGIELQARVTWTFTIRDGAVERICLYQERQEALEAVGLSE